MKVAMLGIVALCAAGATFGWQPPETTRICRTHVDPVLHVEFPNEICGLTMSVRKTFARGEDDYSLVYDSEESRALDHCGRQLEVFVYASAGEPMEDGVNEPVQVQAISLGRKFEELKADGVCEKMKPLDMAIEGRFVKSGLGFMWTSAVLKMSGLDKSHCCLIAVFAWRGRFVKLSYLSPVAGGKSDPPQTIPADFGRVLGVIDDLIVRAEAAAKVDVYAIADPKEAFAALCRKWLGAGDQVSQSCLPDYMERFAELEKASKWCDENVKECAGTLLDVANECVRLRLEPAIWFCNQARAYAALGEKDRAFEALEQSVVAGFDETGYLKTDTDLDPLRDDPRFAKLVAWSRLVKKGISYPMDPAMIRDGRLRLDEKNVYWKLDRASYLVSVANATTDAFFYVDRNAERRVQPPASGMVEVEFSEELQDRGRAVGSGNCFFVNRATRRSIPTILDCATLYGSDPTNFLQSVPARMWCDRGKCRVELKNLYNAVLGVYAIGEDYGHLGVDRVPGWSPVPLVCRGFETDELVRICAEAWRAMNPKMRKTQGFRQLIDVIRRGQKCVTNEASFMSGAAMRPAISVDDLDEEKILRIARGMEKPYPEIPVIARIFDLKSATAANDIRFLTFRKFILASSAHHLAIVARRAERTMAFDIAMDADEGEFVWKVLQGDPSKVRVTKVASGKKNGPKGKLSATFTIESDYQPAFDVVLADGTTMKSTRVDIGCFCVVDGVASMPVIVSIFYMPGETREYGEDGRLKSIDYAKHQIPGWLPNFCPKADFRDEFHWNADGQMTGWTRVESDGERTEFTRDGFVVMTRDAQGRPLDVRRDRTMEWRQEGDAESYTNMNFLLRCAAEYDVLEDHPSRTTLAWRYAYEDAHDLRGKARPKEVVPFRYRPELCSRIDFAEDSGFRLPMVAQMMCGDWLYENYKIGLFSADIPPWARTPDCLRPDGPAALKKKGLTPPAELEKMKFCAWKASTNDVWRLDESDFERQHAKILYELPDGAYRLRVDPKDGGDPCFASVRETYFASNLFAENSAYGRLDRAFRRCTEAETRKLLGDYFDEREWKRTKIAGRRPLPFDERPKGIDRGLALWRISKGVCFGIRSRFDGAFAPRDYFFVSETAENLVSFDDLPSRAIGNTVLKAFEEDAEAMNNLAVLLYGEVANPLDYDEKFVVSLLERSVALGCERAKRNLDVLRHNRGEDGEGVLVMERRDP